MAKLYLKGFWYSRSQKKVKDEWDQERSAKYDYITKAKFEIKSLKIIHSLWTPVVVEVILKNEYMKNLVLKKKKN